MPSVTLIDYGIGNLRSVEKALEAVGADVRRTDDAESIREAERVVLPGVGAFGACAAEIRARGLEPAIREVAERGTPLLGVCVGMQLLYEVGEEMGEHAGLGLLPGRVVRFAEGLVGPDGKRLKVPHMGWNRVRLTRSSPLTEGLPDEPYFYFVHSYHAAPSDPADVLGEVEYGETVPALVQRGNLFGAQFHPEKSQADGLAILRAFSQLPTSYQLR